jgi:hypothetical protein
MWRKLLEEDLLPGQLSAAGGNILHSPLLPVGPRHWHSLPHLTGDKVRHGLINKINTEAKCRHKKNLPVKGLAVFIQCVTGGGSGCVESIYLGTGVIHCVFDQIPNLQIALPPQGASDR